MTAPTPTTDQRDLAVMANLAALRLQVSQHALDRQAAHAAYEIALIHHEWCRVLSGQRRAEAA